MLAYPAKLTPDTMSGGFTVTFRDVPEAITEGDTLAEALLNAEEALEAALCYYVDANDPLPEPSQPVSDEHIVPLTALGMAKAALYRAMQEQAVERAELARRLGWPLARVQQSVNFCHHSKWEHIEAALAALGLRLVIGVERAA